MMRAAPLVRSSCQAGNRTDHTSDLLVPGHVDQTLAYHERLYVCSGEDVVDVWPVDMRGW